MLRLLHKRITQEEAQMNTTAQESHSNMTALHWAAIISSIIILIAILSASAVVVSVKNKRLLNEKELVTSANYESRKELAAIHSTPIVMPDSSGQYMVIFHKKILGDTIVTTSGLLKNQGVRLAIYRPEGMEIVNLHHEAKDFFSFLLTKEQTTLPFTIEILENEAWRNIKLGG